MAHQDIAATVSVVVKYHMDGELAENVFHAKATGVIDETAINDLHSVFLTWLNGTWDTIASEDWTADEIIITDQSSLAGLRRDFPISPPIVGLVASPGAAANSTLAVHASIGRRGRGINGRTFWIGLAENQTDKDHVIAATGTAIVAALNDLATAVASTVGWEGLAIPHLVVAGVRPPVAQSDVVVDYSLADLVLDSQRDRLPGHRRRKKKITGPRPA